MRTPNDRPAFVVNVEVLLHEGDRWLLIRRGEAMANAPGLLGGAGGKAELDELGEDVLERTARREVAEEIGVDLTGVELRYVESATFVTDDGDTVINVVFAAPLPPGARPVIASPREVAAIGWFTVTQALQAPDCPPWTERALRKAAS
jgi:8-oxo-dGTP pyrophosphatase MutT (NUDIX family)